MAKKLIVDPKFLQRNPVAFTVVDSVPPKRVALHGECVIETEDSAGGPAKKVTVPAPTQSDLQALFDQGCTYVIEVQDGGTTENKFVTEKNIAPIT